MIKETKVILTGNAKEEYEQLRKEINEEKKKGIVSSQKQTLLNSIEQKISLLKQNPQQGIHIQKNKIPKIYLNRYGVNNLWKLNISGAWRLIYTIRGNEIEIISLILDIINHKDYEKKFKYKKS